MLRELSTITQTNPAISRSGGGASAAPDSVDNTSAAATSPPIESAASPRIQIDPAAGVILQFLDNRGDVATQSPSFAVVAYLKAGLTRDGYGKEAEAEVPTPITA